MALFVRKITSACFCRISQHQQVYLSIIEYQRAFLRILPIENYNLPFMRPKIPYLSSLLVTCHQSSRLYGVMSFDAQHNENALIPYTDSKVQIRLRINTAQSGQYIRFMITKYLILTEVHRLKWYFKTKC